jgi:hypothetical protein
MSDLAKAGIRLDCSFNPASRAGGSFAGETLEINALQRIDSLWELPLSVVRQSLPEPHLVDGMRPFDLVSLSSWEIRKALDEAHKARTPHIVAVLHSFSGVKPKDVQYWRMKPDRVVRHRVRCFLDHLAANRDRFRVSTCDELVTEMSEVQPSVGGIPPNLGFIHPLTRKVVQAVNSIYWV